MEKTNLEVIEVEETEVQKESKLKAFFVNNKKKVFTGLGLVGAFVLGAIAHSKWTDGEDDEDIDYVEESDCTCDDCTCDSDIDTDI